MVAVVERSIFPLIQKLRHHIKNKLIPDSYRNQLIES
ncbi:hypothetical protein BSNT_10637 [Bacillus subtilis subsp. natto BEST195]|nr:hypothetical protein BSNT_10637 [Bacillus subtilis subsp. natto BEST195]